MCPPQECPAAATLRLTLAVLTILAATAQQPDPDPEIVALTVAEIRRLLNALALAILLPPEHTLRWSIWRRTSKPEPDDPTISEDLVIQHGEGAWHADAATR